MDSYFTVKNLKVNFRNFGGIKKALDLEMLDIYKGETFGLVGESGSGKSVLALTILGLLPIPPGVIESGEIIFQNENLLKKKQEEMISIRGKKISMIFQDPMSSLNPVFTVGEQIIRVICNNEKVSRKEAEKKVLHMIELVKLPDAKNILKKYPHELSGGQRQRIIIAIALSCGAEFLIADEPTRNLDVTIQAGILKLIDELKEELKVTVLFIANNLGLVSAICNRAGIFYKGRIVEMGTVGEVFKNPKHPYTLTLLKAIPKNKEEKIDISRILVEGEKLQGSDGCLYFERCLKREEICRNSIPVLKNIEGTHCVACYKAN
ncbi:MAG: ABC transporter ATP-binding protein [Bacillota bacterium]